MWAKSLACHGNDTASRTIKDTYSVAGCASSAMDSILKSHQKYILIGISVKVTSGMLVGMSDNAVEGMSDCISHGIAVGAIILGLLISNFGRCCEGCFRRDLIIVSW